MTDHAPVMLALREFDPRDAIQPGELPFADAATSSGTPDVVGRTGFHPRSD
jgi:hypothetical protein